MVTSLTAVLGEGGGGTVYGEEVNAVMTYP